MLKMFYVMIHCNNELDLKGGTWPAHDEVLAARNKIEFESIFDEIWPLQMDWKYSSSHSAFSYYQRLSAKEYWTLGFGYYVTGIDELIG